MPPQKGDHRGDGQTVALGDGKRAQASLPASAEDLPAPVQDADAACGEEEGATLEEIERRCLAQALVKTGYNRTHAARLLGITRRTLGYRLRKYGLENELEVLRLGQEARPRDPLRVRPLPLRDVG